MCDYHEVKCHVDETGRLPSLSAGPNLESQMETRIGAIVVRCDSGQACDLYQGNDCENASRTALDDASLFWKIRADDAPADVVHFPFPDDHLDASRILLLSVDVCETDLFLRKKSDYDAVVGRIHIDLHHHPGHVALRHECCCAGRGASMVAM